MQLVAQVVVALVPFTAFSQPDAFCLDRIAFPSYTVFDPLVQIVSRNWDIETRGVFYWLNKRSARSAFDWQPPLIPAQKLALVLIGVAYRNW